MTRQNYLRNIMNKTTLVTKLFVIVVIMLFFLDIFDFKTNLIISLFSLLIIIILYYNQKIRMIQYKNNTEKFRPSGKENIIENFEFTVTENENKHNPKCDKFSARINYHCKSPDFRPYINTTSDDVSRHLKEDIKNGETLYFTENLKKNKYGNTNFLRKTENQRLVGAPNPKTLVQPIITPPIAELSYWRMQDELTPEIINETKQRYEFESGYDVTYEPEDIQYKVQKSNMAPYKRLKNQKTKYPNRYFEKDSENNYNFVENFPYETENDLTHGKKMLHDTEKLLFHKSFNDNQLFKGKYNPNVFTSTVMPGEYRITDRNEPVNSLMGITYPEPFEESNYDVIQPFEDVNVSNTYDPRFSGYGTSYRSYVDEQLGQPRFYYDDIDSVKMPNYIARSNIDVMDFGDSYGPLKEHNPYTRNIHKLADAAYIDSTNDFRADLQRSRMRKRNSEEWQQRMYPISTGGQRMLK